MVLELHRFSSSLQETRRPGPLGLGRQVLPSAFGHQVSGGYPWLARPMVTVICRYELDNAELLSLSIIPRVAGRTLPLVGRTSLKSGLA
jgi:hypothetical protein